MVMSLRRLQVGHKHIGDLLLQTFLSRLLKNLAASSVEQAAPKTM